MGEGREGWREVPDENYPLEGREGTSLWTAILRPGVDNPTAGVGTDAEASSVKGVPGTANYVSGAAGTKQRVYQLRIATSVVGGRFVKVG